MMLINISLKVIHWIFGRISACHQCLPVPPGHRGSWPEIGGICSTCQLCEWSPSRSCLKPTVEAYECSRHPAFSCSTVADRRSNSIEHPIQALSESILFKIASTFGSSWYYAAPMKNDNSTF